MRIYLIIIWNLFCSISLGLSLNSYSRFSSRGRKRISCTLILWLVIFILLIFRGHSWEWPECLLIVICAQLVLSPSRGWDVSVLEYRLCLAWAFHQSNSYWHELCRSFESHRSSKDLRTVSSEVTDFHCYFQVQIHHQQQRQEAPHYPASRSAIAWRVFGVSTAGWWSRCAFILINVYIFHTAATLPNYVYGNSLWHCTKMESNYGERNR